MTEWFSLSLCSCLFLITPFIISVFPQRRLERENSTVARIDRPQDLFLSTPKHGGLHPRPDGECRIQTGCLSCPRIRRYRNRFFRPSPKNALFAFQDHFFFSVDCFSERIFVFGFCPQFSARVGLFPALAPRSRSLSGFPWLTFIGQEKAVFCLGSLLTGGIVSCLDRMDQHYQWTEWSHGLREGLGGLIYNKNLPPNITLRYFLSHSD